MKQKVNISKNERIEKLLIEVKNDNNSVLEELFTLIKSDVYAFALSKVGNKFDAEDIVQDTFVQIFKNSYLYNPIGKPLAWVFTIENNLIMSYFSKKNKFDSYDDSIYSSNENEALEIEDENEKNHSLMKFLTNLGDDEKQIIVLHVVSELKFKEIAKIVSMPLSTVISKYNRAIKKIQKRVRGKENEKERN